jgi:diguanylate cyclase (GGDEF)-like protein
VGIELAQVGEQLELYQELFDHKIYLVDADGLIQIHSDENLVMTAYVQDVLGVDESDAFVLMENDAVNIFEIKADSGPKVVSTRFLSDLEWYLVIEKDESASLKMAIDALWKNIIIGLGITILISGIIVWLIKTYNKRIEYLASFDELTGVLNRRAFLQMLKREMSIAQRYQRPLAVMMIDIDDFKVVNDQFGHMAGDEVLRKITAQLEESLRDSDVVGRWGGDEFIAVLLNTDHEKMLKSAQRLLHTVQSNAIKIGETSLESTVSIGYCLFAGLEELDAEKLIQKADEALLRAKNQGRNQASG